MFYKIVQKLANYAKLVWRYQDPMRKQMQAPRVQADAIKDNRPNASAIASLPYKFYDDILHFDSICVF